MTYDKAGKRDRTDRCDRGDVEKGGKGPGATLCDVEVAKRAT